MERTYSVYILASQRNGTLYVGVTGNLAKRIYEHREGLRPGFTSDYGVSRLVWYAALPTALDAIAFEKRLKRWRRRWKLQLIERVNPQWKDLYLTLNGSPDPSSRPQRSGEPGPRAARNACPLGPGSSVRAVRDDD